MANTPKSASDRRHDKTIVGTIFPLCKSWNPEITTTENNEKKEQEKPPKNP